MKAEARPVSTKLHALSLAFRVLILLGIGAGLSGCATSYHAPALPKSKLGTVTTAGDTAIYITALDGRPVRGIWGRKSLQVAPGDHEIQVTVYSAPEKNVAVVKLAVEAGQTYHLKFKEEANTRRGAISATREERYREARFWFEKASK